MTTLKKYNLDGNEAGSVEALDEVFNAPQNQVLVREAANAYLSNQRQGTHMTKNRALVKGGGKKPWKQKGTGRARAGSSRSPLWVGGGTIFGPQPRSYREKVNIKKRRAALRAVLSNRAETGSIRVVDAIDFSAEPKTKKVYEFLKAHGANERRVLLITPAVDQLLLRVASNIPYLVVATADTVNVNDLLLSDVIFTTEAGLEKIVERAHPGRDAREIKLEEGTY
ncbi:MAG: 50S ribosomal protein L4 [Sumerlaeia bacterium]